jgi:hypothetical protein
LIPKHGKSKDNACSRIQESRFCLSFLEYEEVIYLFMPGSRIMDCALPPRAMFTPLNAFFCSTGAKHIAPGRLRPIMLQSLSATLAKSFIFWAYLVFIEICPSRFVKNEAVSAIFLAGHSSDGLVRHLPGGVAGLTPFASYSMAG